MRGPLGSRVAHDKRDTPSHRRGNGALKQPADAGTGFPRERRRMIPIPLTIADMTHLPILSKHP